MQKDLFYSTEVDDETFSNKCYVLAVFKNHEWEVYIRVGNTYHYADPITELSELPTSIQTRITEKLDKLLADVKRLHPKVSQHSS